MPEANCPNHKDHTKQIERLEEKFEILEKKVYSMESKLDVNEEKFRQIFEKLDEIINIIKVSQSRLPNLAWGVAGSVVGGIAIWLVMNAIQK